MSTARRTAGVWSRKRPLGPNGERICYNCGGPLPKGKPYNCSSKCSEEWRAKTSPAHMRYLLHQRDRGVCALCGLDTDALKRQYDEFRDREKRGQLWNAKQDEFLKAHGIPWGRVVSDWWDADHITPVIEGGGECGLENFRTLCIPCHKKETAELRRRMVHRKVSERWMHWNGQAAPQGLVKPAPRSSPAATLQESLFGAQG
jgi:5-methylcytosine-specific restriction protein A